MGNPLIGNSLFALALALLHAPPMLALLWTQQRLRRRLPAQTEPSYSQSRPLAAYTETLIARRSQP